MRIGFLGLGKMGEPMAKRLLSARYELTVWNRNHDRTTALVKEGAQAAATPADVARASDRLQCVERRLNLLSNVRCGSGKRSTGVTAN